MARPRKHSPEKEAELAAQIEKLGMIHCNWKEIASVTGEEYEYLLKRFSSSYEKGRDQGKMTLKRKMFETAFGGNVTMMIWLSKQYLDHKDKVETETKQDIKVSYTDEEKQAMKEQLKALMEVPK